MSTLERSLKLLVIKIFVDPLKFQCLYNCRLRTVHYSNARQNTIAEFHSPSKHLLHSRLNVMSVNRLFKFLYHVFLRTSQILSDIIPRFDLFIVNDFFTSTKSFASKFSARWAINQLAVTVTVYISKC